MPLHPFFRARLLTLLLLLSLALPLGATRRSIHLSSLGLRAGTKENSTPLLRKVLEGLQSKLEQGTDTLELLFPTGRYHLASEGSAWRTLPVRPESFSPATSYVTTVPEASSSTHPALSSSRRIPSITSVAQRSSSAQTIICSTSRDRPERSRSGAISSKMY